MARSRILLKCSATSAPRRERPSPAGRRSICGSIRSKATARARRKPLDHYPAAADAVVAGGASHRAVGGGEEPADPGGTRIHRRRGRNPGRGFAACRAVWPARGPGRWWSILCAGGGGKTLGARCADGQSRPDRRDRYRSAAAGADPCAAGACRRRQCRGAQPRGRTELLGDLVGGADLVLIDAPCTGIGAWRRNPDAKWRVRPGVARTAHKEPGRACSTRAAASRQARRPHRLRDLLAARRGKRRPGSWLLSNGTRNSRLFAPTRWSMRSAAGQPISAPRSSRQPKGC